MEKQIKLVQLEQITKKKTEELLTLKQLDLSSRKLTQIPPEIGYLTQLQYLYLNNYACRLLNRYLIVSNNELESLPCEISRLTNLKTLAVHSNKLTHLPKDMSKLTNLTYMDAKDNLLVSLPSELSQLSKLETINVRNNKLDCLPVEFTQLSKTTLYVEQNPMKSTPKEVVRMGPKSILKYPKLIRINCLHIKLP
jgi:Leucine-rich repeat (LRR) protein